jgi:hypothetical protein
MAGQFRRIDAEKAHSLAVTVQGVAIDDTTSRDRFRIACARHRQRHYGQHASSNEGMPQCRGFSGKDCAATIAITNASIIPNPSRSQPTVPDQLHKQ